VLLLKRMEHYRTLATIQRYGEDLDEIVVVLDPVTRMISAGPSRQEVDEGEAAQAIVDYLAGVAEPSEEVAIQEAVEGRRKTKLAALRQLVAEGRVARLGSGRKGDRYRYVVSGTQVPTYSWVPENQKPETDLSAEKRETDSGSREMWVSVDDLDPRVPETEAF
jgi:hypothetical protein